MERHSKESRGLEAHCRGGQSPPWAVAPSGGRRATWEACSSNVESWEPSQTQGNQEKPVSRWPVAGPSGYRLLASSPSTKLNNVYFTIYFSRWNFIYYLVLFCLSQWPHQHQTRMSILLTAAWFLHTAVKWSWHTCTMIVHTAKRNVQENEVINKAAKIEQVQWNTAIKGNKTPNYLVP